ncbi:hypothetical protein, unlikely [Trypanosoma brucei gambiense DAL972]|uniref:Uncharacterized protein n=1 Tax=Trypanosoma brucei gambiense (strain MHOM/CI/86/DAL972) TaxID=679716 RepID=C9ZY29_TRYB9|nr:hypothetical protein, unlikely [Trypanosoma brucei gambiense DAL972]CBH14327.1 hypothetical protein, unlikely [Trypanosoma brucei gambiense DAL972]|eukprot:XP_011776594.1 hypothetical protein, unlikely [Trypanosoma brucei gambiense DAL972]
MATSTEGGWPVAAANMTILPYWNRYSECEETQRRHLQHLSPHVFSSLLDTSAFSQAQIWEIIAMIPITNTVSFLVPAAFHTHPWQNSKPSNDLTSHLWDAIWRAVYR